MRKSKYDHLVDAISKRLRDMAPENCTTIEEAVRNDARLAEMGLAAPSSAADYSYCPKCGHPRYHNVCQKCD